MPSSASSSVNPASISESAKRQIDQSYSLQQWLQDPTVPVQSPTPSRAQHNVAPNVRRHPRPRLLLMGQRRSGKSSIGSVVFHKMPPTDTLFLESTTRIQKEPIQSFMDYAVWELPGQIDYNDGSFDLENIFSEAGALIYIIDSQDEYQDALARLQTTIIIAHKYNPQVNIEVFIHKVDGLSDDFKLDTQRDIVQRTQDELSDLGLEHVYVNYHLTSIYDHSIFEAFSKVIQKLIPQLPTLENLLNALCANSRIEKAFLFDVLTKIYISTDSSPVDVQAYEICSDYIDVVLDVTEIYGYDRGEDGKPEEAPPKGEGSGSFEDWGMPDQSSVMKLTNGTVLYLREINKYLALICMMREESFTKRPLVDYNVQVFQQALEKVFEIQRAGVARENLAKEKERQDASRGLARQ